MISSHHPNLHHPPVLVDKQFSSNAAPIAKPYGTVFQKDSKSPNTKNPSESSHSKNSTTEPIREFFKDIKLPKAPDFTESRQKVSTWFDQLEKPKSFNKENLKHRFSLAFHHSEKFLKKVVSLALLYPTLTSFGSAINPFHIIALVGGLYAAYQWHKTKSERHRNEIQHATIAVEQSIGNTCNLANDVILQNQLVEQTKTRLHDRLSKSKYISSMGTDGSSTYTFIDSKPLFLVSDANEEKVYTDACHQLDESKKALIKTTNQLNIDYSTFRFVMGAYGKSGWLAKRQSTKLVNVLSACATDENALQHMSTENFTELQNIVTDSIDKETKRYPGPYSKNISKRFSQLQKRITPQPMTPPPTFFIPPAPPPKQPEASAPEKKVDSKKKN